MLYYIIVLTNYKFSNISCTESLPSDFLILCRISGLVKYERGNCTCTGKSLQSSYVYKSRYLSSSVFGKFPDMFKVHFCNPAFFICSIIPHVTTVFCDHTGFRNTFRCTGISIQKKPDTLFPIIFYSSFKGFNDFLLHLLCDIFYFFRPSFPEIDFRKHLIGSRKNNPPYN